MNCRICQSEEIIKFLDLGFTPPADDFLTPQRLKESEIHYPLEVFICKRCGLVQLGYVVPPELLFQNEYPYESSTTETGRKHYVNLAKEVSSRYNLCSEDLVIDIGSNVGVLLAGFKSCGTRVLGVEPASDVCKTANVNGIETVTDFFSETLARNILEKNGKAKVITGTNVVAHINDLHDFAKGLDILLSEKGVCVFEAPYLLPLLENLEYDTIYHEHLSYLSVIPIQRLFHQYGLDIIDLKEEKIHGGTLRYFIARRNDYLISPIVDEYIMMEKNKKIYDIDFLKEFAQSVNNHRDDLVWLLKSLKHKGNRIAGVSAPAKGMTLLNYCKIGPETLDFLTEKSLLKIGKFSPGMHIPVVPDSELIKQMPEYALLLAWNFADEIMKNLEEYKKKGGKFIIPIPNPRIVE